VTENDCGTARCERVRSTRAAGLVLGEDARDADGALVLARGTLLSERSVGLLSAREITHVAARTPLGCEAGEGVCARCYGANSVDDALVAVGTNVGLRSSRVLEAQAAALATATFTRVVC
jgi:DNA-directed RNA polymerase subunit beta'